MVIAWVRFVWFVVTVYYVVFILDFEELKTEPQNILKKCFRFLDIKELDTEFKMPRIANQGNYQSDLNPDLRQKLKNYFSGANSALKQAFDLPFEWLN